MFRIRKKSKSLYVSISLLALGVIFLMSPEVLAVAGDDPLKDVSAKTEEMLTGSWVRVALIGGGIFGLIQGVVTGFNFKTIAASLAALVFSILYFPHVKNVFTALI